MEDKVALIPLQPLADLFDATVTEADRTVTITRQEKSFSCSAYNTHASDNGTDIILPRAPYIIGNLLYAPVEQLIKTLGGTVSLDVAKSLVRITLPGQRTPSTLSLVTSDAYYNYSDGYGINRVNKGCAIYVINIDGTGLQRLSFNINDVYLPAISTDGAIITSVRNGNVYLRRLDSPYERCLLRGAFGQGSRYGSAVFTPSGKDVLFSGLIDNNIVAGLIHLDGNAIREIYHGAWQGGHENCSPVLSPDEKLLAYIAWRGGISTVCTLNSKGKITAQFGEGCAPIFDQKGAMLTFFRQQFNTKCWISTFAMEGYHKGPVHETLIFDAQDARFGRGINALPHAAYSTDGKCIVFNTNAGKIGIMHADHSGGKGLGEGHWPEITPDGKRIIFLAADELSVMNVDGSEVTPLHVPSRCFVGDRFALSPDGKHIFFVVQPEMIRQLLQADPLATE